MFFFIYELSIFNLFKLDHLTSRSNKSQVNSYNFMFQIDEVT